MSLPAHIGRYQIVGHLASGGMAEILLGKLVGPSGFERPVVIKRILPTLARQQSFRDMFLDEARVVARIQHSNVVQVHELGTEGDELFLAMEYLEGESLLSLMRRMAGRKETIDRPLAAHLVARACAGLHAAHELNDDEGNPLNLVHRDVSPHNLFVTYAGSVKVLDFGIAKFRERNTDTEAGQLKGKFPYMSPEQCIGAGLDRRSDIFSMGTVLFELTTGRRLFARDTSLLTMKAITEGDIPSPTSVDPGYPECLARVCEKALRRDAKLRYQTAADMRRDLVHAIRELEFDEVPEEALSRLMTYLFTDRVGEKKELLRRVSAGSEVTNVPAAEVDVSVELPTVYGPKHKVTPATPFAMETDTGDDEPPSQRRWGVYLAAVAVLAAGIGIGFSLASSPPEADADRTGTAAASQPVTGVTPAAEVEVAAEEPAEEAEPETAEVPEPEPEPEPAVEPATVALRVDSTPPGGTVLVDGEDRGETPTEVTLTQGPTAVTVEIVRRGYVSYETQVVPDEDGAVEARLTRRARRPGRGGGMRRAPMMSAPAMNDSPFRRFN